MKRLLNGIFLLGAAATAVNYVNKLDHATNWIDVFVAVFWIIVSAVAINAFGQDFKHNRWPFFND